MRITMYTGVSIRAWCFAFQYLLSAISRYKRYSDFNDFAPNSLSMTSCIVKKCNTGLMLLHLPPGNGLNINTKDKEYIMMEILEGKQNGSQLYVYNNYTYCKDSRYNDTYRCSKRRTEKCSAVLRQKGESYSLEVWHNHPEELYIIEISHMKKEMIRLCRETTQPFKVIFDTICCTNLKAAGYISYNSMKSIFSRERAKSRPNIPDNLSSLQQQLEIYEPTRSIYKGSATSIDNKIALIFSNNILLKLLSETSEIFVDGTFSIVPKRPNITQLYSIHVRYAGKGIAVVFVLCEVRSASLYKAMWEKIVSLAPGLSENLKFIMADYEKAAITVMSQQFPAASIHGCWFHYSQALYRKWRRLQLNRAPRELLSMAMSMALAPSSLFVDSLNIMQNIADDVSATYPNVLLFMAYLRSTWLPIASKVSVHNCPVRTNNLVESFHHVANQKVGTSNPNLWVFLEHLSEIITSQELDYSRLQNNIRVRRARTQHNKKRDNQIKEGQSALMNGDISLEHFLRMFERFNLHYQPSELLPEANDNEEIDASLLSDRISAPGLGETTYTQSQRRHRSRNSLPRQEDISLSIESSAETTSYNSQNQRRHRSRSNSLLRQEDISPSIEFSAETTYTQNQRRHRSRNSLPRQEYISPSIESSAETIYSQNQRLHRSPSDSLSSQEDIFPSIEFSAETTYTPNQRRHRSRSNSLPRQENISPSIEFSAETTYTQNQRRHRSPNSLPRQEDIFPSIEFSAETTYTQNQRRHRSRSNSSPRQEDISPSIELSAETTYTQNQRRHRSPNSLLRQEDIFPSIEISDDEEIYRIPEDDYSFLEESTSSLEKTYHKIDDVQSIIDNNREPRSAGTCIICLSEQALYIFVPCGHLCVCGSCSNNLIHKRCPMCNLLYDNCIKSIVS